MAKNFVQAATSYQAGSGNVIGATSIIVTSFQDIYGNVLTMSDFGTKGEGTCEPDTNNEEAFTFTGVSANANGTYTLSGVSTQLAKSPYTETSGLVRTHAGGTKVVISNTAGFYNSNFVSKNNDGTITSKITFPGGGSANAPVSGTVYAAPSNDLEYASKKYVDNVAIAGAPDAGTGTKGVTKISVAAVSATNPIAVGDNDPRIPINSYAASATGNDSYAITLPGAALAAYVTGQVFRFKADVANTGACSLNVSGLGAKSLKIGGSDPYDGYIAANAFVECQYDGTNMNIVWCSSAVPVTQKGTEIYAADTGSTNTYAITLTPTPTAYATGMTVAFKASSTNTGACTLNVNSLGAKSIVKNGSQALASGDIPNGGIIRVTYDGTNFQLAVAPNQVIMAMPSLTTTTINSATTVTIFSYTIPVLSANSMVKVEMPISDFSPNGTNGTATFTATYGGGTVGTYTITTFNTLSGSAVGGGAIFSFKNNNATNSQICTSMPIAPVGGTTAGNGYVVSTAVSTAGGTLTIDSTTTQTFTVSCTTSAGIGTFNFVKPIITIVQQA